jgi:hypothetical protein
VRFADVVLRQGHLSDQRVADALMTGDRPAHLDRCDLCAERALHMGRWLTSLKVAATETTDAAFPPERLAAQQAQILRRLEQLDEPSRVIAFPGRSRAVARDTPQRRIAPAWLGVAAAAGLVVGAIGGQMSVRVPPQAAPVPMAAEAAAPEPDASFMLDVDLNTTPAEFQDLDAVTPRIAALQTSGG